MNLENLINQLPDAFIPEAAGDLNVIVQYAASSPAYARIENGKCTIHQGTADSPDVTLKMDDDDMAALLTGELDGMTAFMTGKLQLDGDMMLAQRITTLFDSSKLGS